MKQTLFAAISAFLFLFSPIAAQGTYNTTSVTVHYAIAEKDDPGQLKIDVQGTTSTSATVKKWNGTSWDLIPTTDYIITHGGTIKITFDPGVIKKDDKIWVKGNTSANGDHQVETLPENDWHDSTS